MIHNRTFFNGLQLIAAAVLCAVSLEANGAGSAAYPTIAEVAINQQIGDLLLIRLTVPPTGQPACSNNGYWNYALNIDTTTGKNFYALLMAAMASGKTVSYLNGTGACSDYPGVESLLGINMLN